MRLWSVAMWVAVSSLLACGGGSSDGTVVQGTLTERGGAHSEKLTVQAKHSAGERLEEVKVCVLGQCSITDGLGQWGVNIDNFQGGDIAIEVDGHGIAASVVTNVPASAKEIEIALDHAENKISIAKLMIDGEDHTGHTHDHNT